MNMPWDSMNRSLKKTMNKVYTRYIFLLLVLTGVSGCAKTIDNREMVQLYLAQAPPGQSEYGWRAHYAGLHDGYHHLKVDYSMFGNMTAMIFGVAFRTEYYRCKADTLPENFPKDLEEFRRECQRACRLGRKKHDRLVQRRTSEYLKSVPPHDTSER